MRKRPKLMPPADQMAARGLIGPDLPKRRRRTDAEDLAQASREHHGPDLDMGPGVPDEREEE